MTWIFLQFERFRCWLIIRLGGYWDASPGAHMNALLLEYVPFAVGAYARHAYNKVKVDPSFKTPEGSNLGRNIKRDEAAEWTKIYMKEAGIAYRDSDVNLACELLYHLERK